MQAVISTLRHYKHSQLMQLFLLIITKNPSLILPQLQKHLGIAISNHLQPRQVIYECVNYFEKCSDTEIFTMIIKMALHDENVSKLLQQELPQQNATISNQQVQPKPKSNIVIVDEEEMDMEEAENENSEAPLSQEVQYNTSISKQKYKKQCRSRSARISLADKSMPPNMHSKTMQELMNFSFEQLTAFCVKLDIPNYAGTRKMLADRIYHKFHGVPPQLQALRAKYGQMTTQELKDIPEVPKSYWSRKILIDYAAYLEYDKPVVN